MSARVCEDCGHESKTYWVHDSQWLCATCWKLSRCITQGVEEQEQQEKEQDMGIVCGVSS